MKNILKICLVAVLTLSLLFCIVACNDNGDNGDGTGTSGTTSGTETTTAGEGTTASSSVEGTDPAVPTASSSDEGTEPEVPTQSSEVSGSSEVPGSSEEEEPTGIPTYELGTDGDNWQGFIPF